MRYTEHDYAGVGSRETPLDVCERMTKIAKFLRKRGWLLRSGGAERADQAFEDGADKLKKIFKAKDATPESLDHAAKYHPAWDRCSPFAQRLHGRNSLIMLGQHLNTPVRFVVCWTKGAKAVGGTGQALRIAEAYEIPVYNLWLPDAEAKLRKEYK